MNELDQLRQIKEQGKLSYEDLARELNIGTRTLYRWLIGENKPSKMGLRIIGEYLKSKGEE